MTAPDIAGLPPEPERPEEWECCGSDCGDACIWEIYYREKAEYDSLKKALQDKSGNST